MKLFSIGKDGGPDSNVTGYWLIEWKKMLSICLLKFTNGSRQAYHSHAFNAISWLLKGQLEEDVCYPGSDLGQYVSYKPSLNPIYTSRERTHMVISLGTSWVLSFRGPWAKTWNEYSYPAGDPITLTDGRKIV